MNSSQQDNLDDVQPLDKQIISISSFASAKHWQGERAGSHMFFSQETVTAYFNYDEHSSSILNFLPQLQQGVI